jgi:DNA/RNA endonuclease YhcR with UshA esterase domain
MPQMRQGGEDSQEEQEESRNRSQVGYDGSYLLLLPLFLCRQVAFSFVGDGVVHIALATAIVGLVVLTYASEALEPPYSPISQVNAGFIGKSVHLSGRVGSVHQFKGGSLVLTMPEGNHSVDVFIAKTVADQLSFTPAEGQSIDVIGVVEVYNGRLEVVASKPSTLQLVKDES